MSFVVIQQMLKYCIKQKQRSITIIYCSSRRLVGLVVSKLHACYLWEGDGKDWVRIPMGRISVAVPLVYLVMLNL